MMRDIRLKWQVQKIDWDRRMWHVRLLVGSAQMAERELAKAKAIGDPDGVIFARQQLVRDRHNVIASLPIVERLYAWWLLLEGDQQR